MSRITKADRLRFQEIADQVGLRGLTTPKRAALAQLAFEYDYESAAEAAETDVETVREWARDPAFIDQLGRFIIGLAEVELEG